MAPDRYITTAEAAEMLGLKSVTIRRMISEGELPAVRVAGRRAIRIRVADVEAILQPVQQG